MAKKNRKIKVDTTPVESKISGLIGMRKSQVDSFCLAVQKLLVPEIGKHTIHSWLEIYLRYNRLPVTANEFAEYIAKNSKSYSLRRIGHASKSSSLADKTLLEKTAKRLQGGDYGNLAAAASLVEDMERIYPTYLHGEHERGLFLWAVKILAKENRLTIDNIVDLMNRVLKPTRPDEYHYTRWEISTPMGTGGRRG